MPEDTIYALTSGSVPAGIAVIRISGPEVRHVAEDCLSSLPPPRRAAVRTLRDPYSGSILDRALVLLFPAPHSFTGEDVLELHCHGGPAVLRGVFEALAAIPGLRPAEAGEFTRRAFVNGRLDLTEVEGLADLIAAETDAQRTQALRQSGGALHRLYDGWREDLLRVRAAVEASLDFSDEDDVPENVAITVWPLVEKLAMAMRLHLKDAQRGERLRRGLEIVLLGKPNAGKSSLLNALSGREVAIVAAEAGTTRDLVEVRLDLAGVPVTLIDTAGLRDSSGSVEKEGMRRAHARAAAADLVMWLWPPDSPYPDTPAGVAALDVPIWIVLSKADKGVPLGYDSFLKSSRTGLPELSFASCDAPFISASTVTLGGLDNLIAALSVFAKDHAGLREEPVATRARHRHHLAAALAALDTVLADASVPVEVKADHLRHAAENLGRITGRIDVDDVLEVIFAEFCIGK